MFALQNAPVQSLEVSERFLSLTPIATPITTAKFDLSLSVEETEQGLVGAWEYNTDLFDASAIARMQKHFHNLLLAIVEHPQQRLSELSLLSPNEQHQLLVEWNHTQTDYPHHCCIHQLFEAQVEQTPDAIALAFEQQQLSYSELNRHANQLAHHLQQLGIGPDVRVGICVQRSLEMVVGLLGILKAGGAYVPLDPTYPPERLAFILQDSQMPVLLTQQSLVSELPAHDAHIVCLDTDWAVISQTQQDHPISDVQPQHLSYVIYTSGSTGTPKAVLVPHQGVVNFLEFMRVAPGLTSQDIFLAVTTISFDIAALELYLPLTGGAQVVLVPRNVVSNGVQLSGRIVNSGATVMQATPATWHLLLATGWKNNSGIRILVGGEALPQQLAKQLLEIGDSVWNLYGPTETTIWSTVYQLKRSSPVSQSLIEPIGQPIANTQIYILNSHMQPVPIGVPGELYIGGAGLARGYFNRPDLTADKFIPHPFSTEPGARLYKTGDLARYLPDGNIEFLGRLDSQVKIRGFRIEVGEIEAVLRQHPTVRESVVSVREQAPTDKRLVAYVIAHPKLDPPTSGELRSFLKQRLPEYMVPYAFVTLEAFPLTPNGKIDRKALPAPDSSSIASASTFVAPRTPVEEMLAGLWAEVLGIEWVGIYDNFFELGGHSLLATQVISRVRNNFAVELPLRSLFEEPTLAGLSQRIEQFSSILDPQTDSQYRNSLVAIQPGNSKRPLFCIHELSGTIIHLMELTNRLDPSQPLYGLESLGINGEHQPFTRIEDMAAYYIKAMRTVQEQGPYLLIGWSFGGLVAFEMAQQLEAQGQQVSLLGLLDTNVQPLMPEFLAEQDDETFLMELFGEISSDDLQQLGINEKLINAIEQAKKQKIIFPTSRTEEFQNVLQVCKSNYRAMQCYVPQPYKGRVTLFQAQEGLVFLRQNLMSAWEELASEGLEIYQVSGNHYTMLKDPHVQVLAKQLQACLERVQSM
jgi:amino acid adenylation domain-containing protein